jgi:glycyl-tRNA synthetase beta chain
MAELLVEVGCEELPASFVERAFTELRDNLAAKMGEAGILESEGQCLGTPRRLIAVFPSVKERQEDQTKEQRGPGVKAAYDAEGNPTQALLGFCRSNGVEPSDLRNDGEYVWATKTIKGQDSQALLSDLVPKVIRGLTFAKAMRWGESRMRFARPIRWIVATLNGEVVPFEIEGVPSGSRSRGHRFYAPEEFDAPTSFRLLEGLRVRFVEPDPAVRRAKMVEQIGLVSTGKPQLSDELIDENVFLTEWPTAIEGQFKREYEVLPVPVLVTAMAKHEKMFPVRDEGGKLTNRFVFVRNSGEDATVRQGAEWVLNARFNDAKFFFDEDGKHTLDEFIEKTGGIVFSEKLGTVLQRTERLSKLTEHLATRSGADSEEAVLARTAGKYAKADLSTGLVSELPALQGIVGGEYARREGMLDEVCWAIASHYDLGRNPKPDCPGGRTAVRVTMADQLDKLAGYLGVGLEPSGSKDPFGLRRAATMLIEAAWSWPAPLPSFDELLAFAASLYTEQGIEVDASRARASLADLFAGRYETLMPDVRHDLLDAAILADVPAEVTTPRAVRMRVRCMELVAADVPFIQTATRPLNIVADARKKGIAFVEENPLAGLSLEALQSPTGVALHQALIVREEQIAKAAAEERAEDLISLLRGLQKPITDFFEGTMVMVDEEDVRSARLTLLQAASLQLRKAGDFTKIVIEG